MRQDYVELLNYIDLGEGGQQRSRVSSSDTVTVEADFQARVVWIRAAGKPDRWVPFEQVKSGACTETVKVIEKWHIGPGGSADRHVVNFVDPADHAPDRPDDRHHVCTMCNRGCTSAAGLAAHVRACSLRAKPADVV